MIKDYYINKNFKSIWGKKILQWYHSNKRDLPWRKKNNQNFYAIWISEVMLQQTGVKTVIPYYKRFLKKWPNLDSFFKATEDEILFLWQGLGYYQRAKNLYKAKEILKKIKLEIEPDVLKKLPGIGDYISCSICAILNDKSSAVIDANIKRILTRAFDLDIYNNKYNHRLKSLATKLTPEKNNRYYCQSLMDLANLVCKPKKPLCIICPINDECLTKNNILSKLRVKKIQKKKKIGVSIYLKFKDKFAVETSRKRLLQGLAGFPITNFIELKNNNKIVKEQKLLINAWLKKHRLTESFKNCGIIEHEFSHFYLKLLLVQINLRRKLQHQDFKWLTKEEFEKRPRSKLMNKVKEKLM